jgi:hypothetical protein
MKGISVVLAIGSTIAGVVAAYLWWKASRVEFQPFDEAGTLMPTSEVDHWLHAVRLTLGKAGRLNRSAALWTAGAVALAGASSLTGALNSG